jgi:hypothetical protein
MANETPNTTATTTPATPAHPLESAVISAPPAANPPPAADEPLYRSGDLEIKDPKQLAEYARSLETKLVTNELQNGARQGMPSLTPVTPEPPPAKRHWKEEAQDVFYTDPARAIDILQQGILGDLDEAEKKKETKANFWKEFYDENPDLKELGTVVNSVMLTKSGEINPMKVGDAKKFLAAESRKIVAKIRGAEETRETLPAGQTVTVTGGPGFTRGAPAPAAPRNFVDQVSSMQDRRRTRK